MADSFSVDCNLYLEGSYGEKIRSKLNTVHTLQPMRLDIEKTTPVTTSTVMTASDWQKIIDSACKAHHSTLDSLPSSSRKCKFQDDLSIDGNVRVLDQSFFEKNFNMRNSTLQALINNIVDGSNSKQPLNNEQERAFRIIANHLSLPHQKQLLMYLGGMGGTGKTKVINSVLAFFAYLRSLQSVKNHIVSKLWLQLALRPH